MILLPRCYVAGQKQGNVWYFGNHAGVSFNSGVPVALTDGQLPIYSFHNEGSAAISESNGSLLFYTNGMTVWNRDHQVMQNGTGLLGNFSSTQSSFIIPDPAHPNRYFYVFTVGSGFCCNGSISDGFRYSKVDICQDNLRGAVLAGQKNIRLVDTVAEKIAATRHANGKDYWILTHKFYSDEFWALHLSSNGITDTVITSIGTSHKNDLSGSQGQLKISPDGRRIAIAAGNSDQILEVFHFDNATGIVSNALYLAKPNNNQASMYGVEFSPDNTKLYAYGLASAGLVRSILVQYNLTAGGGSAAAVNASIFELFNYSTGYMDGRGLQAGPDQKIYCVSTQDATTLAVINQPNVAGAGCNFQDKKVSLAGRVASYSLPSFVSNFDYSNKLASCDTGSTIEPVTNTCMILSNPFSASAEYRFNNPSGYRHSLGIYNSIGQLVRNISNITTDRVQIERHSLAKGMYFLVLYRDSRVMMKCKFMIL
jgi:large repetitive protein